MIEHWRIPKEDMDKIVKSIVDITTVLTDALRWLYELNAILIGLGFVPQAKEE